MATLSPEGIRTDLTPEVLAEITFDSPESAIGSMDVALETEQLMAKSAIELIKSGDLVSAQKVLTDSIQYAGFQRARIKAFEESNK